MAKRDPKTTQKRPALSAQKRKLLGRKIKSLRREGKLPANVFGKKVKSQAIVVDTIAFQKIFRKVGETSLIDIDVSGEKTPRAVLITDTQYDPVSDHLLHVNFHQVDLTEKVTADIPVKITGESPAVKEKAAVLVTVFNEIEVEALPTDLPDHFTVDISKLLEFGDSIHVKDLKASPKVEIKVGGDEVVVTLQEPKEEEEEAAPPAEETVEGEEISGETADDVEKASTEKPAEGEKTPQSTDDKKDSK